MVTFVQFFHFQNKEQWRFAISICKCFFSFILIDFLICSSESCNSVTEDCSGPEQGISHLLREMREQVEVTNLQLAGCNTDCGSVEVKLDGGPSWLAVCADGWSLKEARVVCKQLGFKETLGAPTNYKVGKKIA